MKYTFFAPDKSDKRIAFAAAELKKIGYDESENADFILLGVNPKPEKVYNVPCFAGNVSGENIYDYTKDEGFATKNAYLTAEGALSLATGSSDKSLINSNILIVGYGRIGKALHRYAEPFTKHITVCARSNDARTLASINGADVINFGELIACNKYDFIFNTVPHPVFNEKELKSVDKDCMLMDLASFPGGVDKHFAQHFNINLVIARGLPAVYSPKSAGQIVAKTVDKMAREVLN